MSRLEPFLSLGLSEAETTLYLALLRLGGVRASTVAKDTGMKRTTVYALLKSLANKGFITMYLRKNTQLYYAESPERVRHFFEKKLMAFNDLIPSLEAMAKKNIKIAGVRTIETVAELKLFYETVLIEQKNKSYCIIGNRFAWQNLDDDFFNRFRHERARAKIKTRLLLTHSSRSGDTLDQQPLLRTIKYLPPKYNFASTIDIYNDKILIVGPELSALAIVIAISPMVDVFRTVFELLWDLVPAEKNRTASSK